MSSIDPVSSGAIPQQVIAQTTAVTQQQQQPTATPAIAQKAPDTDDRAQAEGKGFQVSAVA